MFRQCLGRPSQVGGAVKASQRQSRSHYTYSSPGIGTYSNDDQRKERWSRRDFQERGFTVGIGGPVGSGKVRIHVRSIYSVTRNDMRNETTERLYDALCLHYCMDSLYYLLDGTSPFSLYKSSAIVVARQFGSRHQRYFHTRRRRILGAERLFATKSNSSGRDGRVSACGHSRRH
jgi:hypothetical protein